MSTAVITMSPTGQLTLPKSLTKLLNTKSLLAFFENGSIKLKPIEIEKKIGETVNTEDQYWLEATSKSLSFWDNDVDDKVWNHV